MCVYKRFIYSTARVFITKHCNRARRSNRGPRAYFYLFFFLLFLYTADDFVRISYNIIQPRLAMMDSDSAYKPNGDYLLSPYGWHHHAAQDLQQQFAANAPTVTYAYGDYGPVVVKSEYDDCGGVVGTDGGDRVIVADGIAGDGGGGEGIDGGSGAGSSSSPGLEPQDSVEPKKGTWCRRVL